MGTEHTGATDDEEALQLYEALEREIVPMFFERDTRGVPNRWVATMRQSMRYLTTQFSADRTVREYTERHYLPMAARYRERVADSAALGRSIAAWHERIRRSIHRIHHTGPMIVSAGSDAPAGSDETTGTAPTRVALFVYLDGVRHDEIGVELYADPIGDGTEPTVVLMEPAEALVGADNAFRYEADVPSGRDVVEFTARFVPRNDAVAIPLEEPAIAWVAQGTDQ